MACEHVLYTLVVKGKVPDTFWGKICFNPTANFKTLNYVMPGNRFADIFNIQIAEN